MGRVTMIWVTIFGVTMITATNDKGYYDTGYFP